MDRIVAARVFVETVERGSATAAADALGMSRAMASRYLADFERWAGTRVLHRTTRRLSLTTAGERVLALSREILRLADEMEAVADDAGNPHGTLRVAAPVVLAEARLTDAIAEFLRRYPRISIDLRASDVIVDLVEDRVDVAIRIGSRLDSSLIARRLRDCRSILCAAPDYLRRHGIPAQPDDLAALQCLIYGNFDTDEWALHSGDAVSAIPVRGSFRTNEALVLRRAALAGIGVAALPRLAVTEQLQSGALVHVLPAWEPAPLPVHAVYASRAHLPAAVRVFIDFVHSELDLD